MYTLFKLCSLFLLFTLNFAIQTKLMFFKYYHNFVPWFNKTIDELHCQKKMDKNEIKFPHTGDGLSGSGFSI